MAASYLIQRNDLLIVYDFGRGVATRLTELGLKQSAIKTIVLSHFHPDHVSDLYPFLHAASWSRIDPRSDELTIYGHPGVSEFIPKLLSVFDQTELTKTFDLKLIELQPGPVDIGGQSFEFVDLHHSFGMKFQENGKKYAIMTDSTLHDDLIHALSGVDLGIFSSGHISDEEIVELAVSSQARQLVCSHQYRSLDQPALQQAAEDRGYRGRLVIAEDLMKFSLDASV
jgi:ribonuclease BN (tRNA processing enzyme)